jgi:hypothetical protein
MEKVKIQEKTGERHERRYPTNYYRSKRRTELDAKSE